MANTEYDALVAILVPKILAELAAGSTAAGEIERVQNLDNIKALAAYRRVGGTEKTVEVPLDILTRPIDDIVAICEQAAASVVDAIARTNDATAGAIEGAGAANVAAQAATEAAATILALKDDTLAAAQEARDGAKEARDEAAQSRIATEESTAATEESKTITSNANDAEADRAAAETGRVDAEKSRVSAETERVDTEKQRAAAETGRDAAERDRVAAEKVRVETETVRGTAEGKRVKAEQLRTGAEEERALNTAAMLEDAGAAVDRMTELSDHPTYIGEDYYVYRWSEAAKAYQRTDIYTKGEGLDYTTMTDEEKANITGRSAYDVAVEEGFGGTEEEWLASLVGPEGKSAYGVAVAEGFEGTVEEWLSSLKGAAGRDFEVPTLADAPGEDTLTYEVDGAQLPFRIGQLARVWDAERGEGGEYVFYQLYDLAGGKTLWKLSGSGDFELPGETVTITLESNHANFAQHLLGAVIRVTHPGEEVDLVWQGQPLTVQINPMVDYRVEGRDVALFAAPEAVDIISGIGYTRKLTLTYLAELATITATTDDGGDNPGAAEITVTDESTAAVYYQGTAGAGVQAFIPYGHRYRVSAAASLPLYFAPEDQVFTAENQSRSITVEYRGFPRTHVVFDKTIADPANITGAGEGAIVDILAKMRRCLCKKTADGEVAISYLNDANSNQYADGTTSVLTGNDGDVMVYKPAFYYKYESVDADRFAYTLSEYDLGGGYIYSPASLIGAYKSNNVGSKLYSRSGVAPSGSISQANNIAYAQARGTGYNIIDFEQHCMIALLFYAKYGTRNSQAVLGAGSADYYGTNNGTTNALGNADTVAATSGHASFAGIEGVHGCAYEWVGGLTINNGVWTITNPDGTTRNGNMLALTSGWGNITEIAAAVGPYFDMIPTAVGGSASTYYADLYQYSSSGRVLARSCNGTSTYGGVSCAYAYYDSSNAYSYFASRLAFRGVIREAESVQAFKALPVL